MKPERIQFANLGLVIDFVAPRAEVTIEAWSYDQAHALSGVFLQLAKDRSIADCRTPIDEDAFLTVSIPVASTDGLTESESAFFEKVAQIADAMTSTDEVS